ADKMVNGEPPLGRVAVNPPYQSPPLLLNLKPNTLGGNYSAQGRSDSRIEPHWRGPVRGMVDSSPGKLGRSDRRVETSGAVMRRSAGGLGHTLCNWERYRCPRKLRAV